MRYDCPVYMQRMMGRAVYNTKTGDREGPLIVEDLYYADMTTSGVQTLLGGGEGLEFLRKGGKVLRIQGELSDVYRFCRIGAEVYRIKMRRQLKRCTVFVISQEKGGYPDEHSLIGG